MACFLSTILNSLLLLLAFTTTCASASAQNCHRVDVTFTQCGHTLADIHGISAQLHTRLAELEPQYVGGGGVFT